MSINIALKPELEESLTRHAEGKGVSLDTLLVQVIEEYATRDQEGLALSPEEKAKAFRAWAESHSPRRVSPLSDEAISRESLYARDDEEQR